MTAVNLRRVDPAPNMRRFYRLDMQPDLFGGVCTQTIWTVTAGADHVPLIRRPQC